MARGSIDRTLRLTVILTTGISLLLTSLAFVAYDVITLRRAITQETGTLARLVGINSAVALTFDDPATAGETLQGLGAAERVMAAAIYDRSGSVFASYLGKHHGGPKFRSPPIGVSGHHFGEGYLDLFRPIVFEGENLGSVLVRADTRALARRVGLYSVVVTAVLAVAFTVGMLISRRLQQQITRPIAELAEGSGAIADGDLSAHVADGGDNEVGALARSFNSMAAGLRDLVTQVRHSIGDVSEVAAALQLSGGQVTLEAQRQTAAIDETSESIGQVSASINEVNANVEQLADSARGTSSSILELDDAIGEIATHMDRLAEAIEKTSEGVNQVAADIDEVVGGGDTLERATDGALIRLHQLSTSVAQVRMNASESQELSEASSSEAIEGRGAVRETIAAMGEISTSFGQLQERVARLASKSNSIDEIVQVISSVAEQTSLLSLNAAIIAAQSGEQGKAFSVVADQVKNLADRSHRSAQEIADLIQAVQSDTAAAVSAVDEGSSVVQQGVQRSKVAGEVLERIIEKSRVSTDRVREISAATSAQAGDLESVDQAMLEVRSIVERINTSTRSQHRATNEIAQAVENIRSLGERVRSSTEEQRKGSRLITDAVTSVATMIGQIAEATQAQTKSSETIEHSLQVFRDVNGETTRRGEDINAMVDRLSERSQKLEREIGRFKTE